MLSSEDRSADALLAGIVGCCMANSCAEDAEAYLADFLSFAAFHDAAEREAFALRAREIAAWLRTQEIDLSQP